MHAQRERGVKREGKEFNDTIRSTAVQRQTTWLAASRPEQMILSHTENDWHGGMRASKFCPRNKKEDRFYF